MFLSSPNRLAQTFRRILTTPNNTSLQSRNLSLWRALESGTEEPIHTIDLFRYQRYRWLSGDSEKLAVRYREFNLQALLDTCIRNLCHGDSYCVKLLKLVEGQFNKAFLLTMSNGLEVVARLPNPNAGPAFYTVASEVATRHFLRDKIGIPIPRIYDWSAKRDNSVGAEYILEEKATGQPLGSIWAHLTLPAQLDIVSQIVDMEKKLASFSFPYHGSMYYETDLKSTSLDYKALTWEGDPSQESAMTQNDRLQNNQQPVFVVGPSANSNFSRDERAVGTIDKGPWKTIADYATAIGNNEIEWASSYARPRMNFHRSLKTPEAPSDYIALIRTYLSIVPFLVASSGPKQPNTISHPDLHLDNIFVDQETNRITYVIDWQHASIAPMSLQRSYPQMLELSASPQSDQGQRERTLLDHYHNSIQKVDPCRWEIPERPLLDVTTNPILLAPGCWDRGDLFALRNALIAVVAHWDVLGYGNTPCPVSFSKDELLQHQDEMDLLEGISTILHELQEGGLIPLGGMVRPEYYECAREFNDIYKHKFIKLAEDDDQRILHAKVWPY